ncbi:Kinesin-like protein kip2 [Tulasnella sp. 419]|nr:Kinesin-like protein kip2 [Tulasnella sp. 419]
MDENRAMNDLNSRIKQLTKLILTSQTVEDSRGDESRPASPTKLDFDLTPFQLQEQLLAAKRTIESQATQILSLEASLSARPLLPADAPETEKDRLIDDLRKTVRELEIVTAGYEDNLGAPLRAVKEDVENEWKPKVEELESQLEDKSDYIQELERALEREKQMRLRAQQEKLALAGFVRLIDSHISSTSSLSALSSSSSTSSLSGPPTSSLLPTSRPSLSPVTERTKPARGVLSASTANKFLEASPKRPKLRRKTSMLDVSEDEISMLMETEADRSIGDISFSRSPARIPFADKENAPPA